MGFLRHRLFHLQMGMGKRIPWGWASSRFFLSIRDAGDSSEGLVQSLQTACVFSKASLGPVSALAGSGSDSTAPVWDWSLEHFPLETILT